LPKRAKDRPTDAELAILAVLWNHGPATVREVQAELGAEVGYTTVLKLLQIMTEKGLVVRDASQRAHVYAAARPREETRGGLVDDLIARAFDGSARKLVMQALASERASADDLAAIRELLDELEERGS
jgi:predicted transcriptional regulator